MGNVGMELYTPAEIEAVRTLGWSPDTLQYKTPRQAGEIILALAERIRQGRFAVEGQPRAVKNQPCPVHGDRKG